MWSHWTLSDHHCDTNSRHWLPAPGHPSVDLSVLIGSVRWSASSTGSSTVQYNNSTGKILFHLNDGVNFLDQWTEEAKLVNCTCGVQDCARLYSSICDQQSPVHGGERAVGETSCWCQSDGCDAPVSWTLGWTREVTRSTLLAQSGTMDYQPQSG